MTAPAKGDVFVSRSGRRWECSPSRWDRQGHVYLSPLGPDTPRTAGGVKGRQVEIARLVNETHGWRRSA